MDEDYPIAPDTTAAAAPRETPASGAGNVPPAAVASPTGEADRMADARPFDFCKSAILPAREFRRLWQRQEEFARRLADRLSLYLRLEVKLKLSDLDTMAYGEFVSGLATPTHLSLFKLEPLRGVCLLNLPPTFGLAIVDRLLGGPGAAPEIKRDLSDIELALLEQVVRLALEEWRQSWRDLQDLTPVLLGHETNGKYVQSSSQDTSMLVLALDAKLGDRAVLIQLAIPFHTLTPLLRQLAPSVTDTESEPDPATATMPPLRAGWEEIPIPVVAEWHDLELTARELGALKVGDVIQLAPECASQVRVRLADQPRFQGRLGTQADRWAVELVQSLKS